VGGLLQRDLHLHANVVQPRHLHHKAQRGKHSKVSGAQHM
jgi:hypothetical protein